MSQKVFTTSASPTIIIEMVGGNLNASGADLEQVTANDSGSTLNSVQDGDKVVLSSDGNLNVEAPRGSNITIQFVGGNLNLQDFSGETIIEFVGGTTTMNNVSRVKTSNNPGNKGFMKDFMKDFGKDFGKDFNPMPPDFGERIQRKVEQATRRAEEAGRRAQRHAEQVVRRAERHARAHGRVNVNVGRWKWDMTPHGTPTPPSDPVTDEERMAILRMLQEKKISAEDAEKLLSALDGGKQ